MRDKPYMSYELFDIIYNKLETNNLLPDCICEHISDTYRPKELKKGNFDIYGQLCFGNSKEITLCMIAKGYITQEEKHESILLGAFVSNNAYRETCNIMGNLMSDFIWETYDFIYNNINDFEWS